MVPTKSIRTKPVCKNIAVVIPKPVPIAVARTLDFPREFLAATGTDRIFDEGHGQFWGILLYKNVNGLHTRAAQAASLCSAVSS